MYEFCYLLLKLHSGNCTAFKVYLKKDTMMTLIDIRALLSYAYNFYSNLGQPIIISSCHQYPHSQRGLSTAKLFQQFLKNCKWKKKKFKDSIFKYSITQDQKNYLKLIQSSNFYKRKKVRLLV